MEARGFEPRPIRREKGGVIVVMREQGNWVNFRQRFGLSAADEVDLHFGRRDPHTRYEDVMADVEQRVRESLRKAQETGRSYVMFIHGWSTSRPGQTTARSIVRSFIRSKEATPFIVRADCIQHDTVFIAKIKQLSAVNTRETDSAG